MNAIYKISAICLLLLVACKNESKNNVSLKPNVVGTNEVLLTKEQIQSVNINMGDVEIRNLKNQIFVSGTLTVPNDKKAKISAVYGGNVTQIYVQLGQVIAKGQKIAKIVNPELIQLKQDFLTLKNKLQLSKIEFERQKVLVDEQASALKNKQQIATEIQVIQTQMDGIVSKWQMLGLNKSKLLNNKIENSYDVLSPISGQISQLYLQLGNAIDNNTPIAEVVDNNQLLAELRIYESDLPNIKTGQKVAFELINAEQGVFQAEISSIGSAFEENLNAVPVFAKIIGSKKGLIEGMTISGKIVLNQQSCTAVPSSAVVQKAGKHYVFFVKKMSGKSYLFERKEVKTSITEGGFTGLNWIEGDFRGQRVVTDGAFFVMAQLNQKEE